VAGDIDPHVENRLSGSILLNLLKGFHMLLVVLFFILKLKKSEIK
jgi:hypothetical protein